MSLAYALNKTFEKAEAILLRAQTIDPKVALIVLENGRMSAHRSTGREERRGHLLMTVSAVEC